MEEEIYEFDGDKLLEGYKNMSIEEVASFLGPKHAKLMMEKLQQENFTRDEIYEICLDAYPEYDLRAKWIGNIIALKLPEKTPEQYYRAVGMTEDEISMVMKMTDYSERAQNGTLKESELQEICNMVFGENTDIGKQVYEALKIKTLPDEIDEYIEYREQLNKLYLENQNSDQALISSFEMIDGDKKLCKHTLEQNNGNNKSILMEKTFEFDAGFQLHFLEPALIDFARHNSANADNMSKNERNIYSYDYQVFSTSNNTLKLTNINPAYANTVAYVLSQIEPAALEKHKSKNEFLDKSYQKVLVKNGFIDSLGVTLNIIFTIICITCLIFCLKLIFTI